MVNKVAEMNGTEALKKINVIIDNGRINLRCPVCERNMIEIVDNEWLCSQCEIRIFYNDDDNSLHIANLGLVDELNKKEEKITIGDSEDEFECPFCDEELVLDDDEQEKLDEKDEIKIACSNCKKEFLIKLEESD